MSDTKKPWPPLQTDDELASFVENVDLSEYDWGKPEAVRYEFEDKSARITMRLPESQLARIKAEAERRGVKYQRFMRELMERGFQSLRG